MSDKNLTVVALIKVDKDKVEETKKELLKLVKETHKEEGCITYDLHQSLDDPAVLMIYENWTSKEALQKHLSSDHFKEWSKKEKNYLCGPAQVFMLKKVS